MAEPHSPWVLTQDGNILIHLESGRRITILPANKRPEDDVQLYGVFAQSPAEANQALSRPLPTGFSNTVLLNGGTLDDCQNLLAIFARRLGAYEISPCPIMPPDEEENACYVLLINGPQTNRHAVADDEETASDILLHYVTNNWRRIFGDDEIPADRTEAINLYFDEGAKEESYQIVVAPFIRRKDLTR
jgi:hypothetical protein